MIGELQIPQWPMWIVIYFFAGGIASGAYFTSAIIELAGRPQDRPVARMGYYIAFPLSIVCAIALIVDLGQPLRFWHMVVNSKTFLPDPKWNSPMSIGAYALLFFGLFSFLSFMDALVETGRLPWAPLRLKYNSVPRKIYAVLGALNGFFLASYTGVLLAVTHLPVWATNPLLGAVFLASAASTGIAAVTLGLLLSRQTLVEPMERLRETDSFAIVVEIVLLIVFLVLLGAATAQFLLSGLRGVLLIGGTFLLGLVVPLIMELRARQDRRMLLAATALILIGGLLMRMAIVLGGQDLI